MLFDFNHIGHAPTHFRQQAQIDMSSVSASMGLVIEAPRIVMPLRAPLCCTDIEFVKILMVWRFRITSGPSGLPWQRTVNQLNILKKTRTTPPATLSPPTLKKHLEIFWETRRNHYISKQT